MIELRQLVTRFGSNTVHAGLDLAIESGEVIALVGGLDVTLKKFYRENGRVRLQPANAAMQPMIMDASLVQLQGVVVGVMRKY